MNISKRIHFEEKSEKRFRHGNKKFNFLSQFFFSPLDQHLVFLQNRLYLCTFTEIQRTQRKSINRDYKWDQLELKIKV